MVMLMACNQAMAFCPALHSGTCSLLDSNARGRRLKKSAVFHETMKMTVSDTTFEIQRVLAKEAFLAAATAGPKNGVGCTPEQRKEIEGKLAILVELNPTKVRTISAWLV